MRRSTYYHTKILNRGRCAYVDIMEEHSTKRLKTEHQCPSVGSGSASEGRSDTKSLCSVPNYKEKSGDVHDLHVEQVIVYQRDADGLSEDRNITVHGGRVHQGEVYKSLEGSSFEDADVQEVANVAEKAYETCYVKYEAGVWSKYDVLKYASDAGQEFADHLATLRLIEAEQSEEDCS